jgi:hypothetical protein
LHTVKAAQNFEKRLQAVFFTVSVYLLKNYHEQNSDSYPFSGHGRIAILLLIGCQKNENRIPALTPQE